MIAWGRELSAASPVTRSKISSEHRWDVRMDKRPAMALNVAVHRQDLIVVMP